MDIHSGSEGSSTAPANDTSYDSAALARVLRDVERCEALIAHGARTAAPVEEADIEIVRATRLAVEQNTLNVVIEADFQAAKGRIEQAVRYPGGQIVDDMDRCGDMVSYAGRVGKFIPESDVLTWSDARAAQQKLTWDATTEARFYAGMSRIAGCIAPVMADTAGRQACKGAQVAIKVYTWSAFTLAFFVISLSCLLFVDNQISEDVSKVVVANDSAALTMHNLLQAYSSTIIEAKEKHPETVEQLQNTQPALQIKELLQQFATNNRQLYADVKRTEAIKKFLFGGAAESPYKPACGEYVQTGKRADAWNVNLKKISDSPASADFTTLTIDWNCDPDTRRHALEITLPLLATEPMDEANQGDRAGTDKPWRPEAAVEQGFQKIAVYQDLRAMATNDRDVNLALVGAITSFLLPVLYAWLGACAAILRQLSAESSASLFHPKHSKVAYRAHITTAVIVGISIGLFTGILQGGKDLPPLAIAFVAGYASDKFFAFIDRVVNTVFPARVPAQADTPAPKNVPPPADAAPSGAHA